MPKGIYKRKKEHKLSMSLAQIKRFKDNPMSDDYKDKIRQSLKGRNTGENNPKWKGGVYKLVDAIRKK